MTALQHNVFLTVIHRLLVTKKTALAFPSANKYQGQLQTPQSVSAAAILRPSSELGNLICLHILKINNSIRTFEKFCLHLTQT
jgi:hypothetical protein